MPSRVRLPSATGGAIASASFGPAEPAEETGNGLSLSGQRILGYSWLLAACMPAFAAKCWPSCVVALG
jgi:hypothetical protein